MAFAKFYECLEVVLYIALKLDANPVVSKEICEYMNVKPRHLEPIMQQLVKSSILKGTKGPKGGYRLAKEKRKITTLEIYKSVMSEVDANCEHNKYIKNDIIVPFSRDINGHLFQKLNVITVEELCSNISDSKRLNKKSEEFNI